MPEQRPNIRNSTRKLKKYAGSNGQKEPSYPTPAASSYEVRLTTDERRVSREAEANYGGNFGRMIRDITRRLPEAPSLAGDLRIAYRLRSLHLSSAKA